MKVDLNERVAIVTGGAHGIGRAIVQALSDNGAHIVIVDIDAEAGEKAANEIIEGGGACMSLAGDVSDMPNRWKLSQSRSWIASDGLTY